MTRVSASALRRVLAVRLHDEVQDQVLQDERVLAPRLLLAEVADAVQHAPAADRLGPLAAAARLAAAGVAAAPAAGLRAAPRGLAGLALLARVAVARAEGDRHG